MTTGTSDVLAAIDSALEDCTVSGDAMRWCPDAGRVICDGGHTLWPTRQREYTIGGWPSSWMGSATFRDCGGGWNVAGGEMTEINAASQAVARAEDVAWVRVTVDPASLPQGGSCKVLLTEPIDLAAGTLVILETSGIPGAWPGTSWRTEQDCTMTSLWCG